MCDRAPRMLSSLPQLSSDRVFLTDGGLETTIVFHSGIDLPAFAAFPLPRSSPSRVARSWTASSHPIAAKPSPRRTIGPRQRSGLYSPWSDACPRAHTAPRFSG